MLSFFGQKVSFFTEMFFSRFRDSFSICQGFYKKLKYFLGSLSFRSLAVSKAPCFTASKYPFKKL
ncbi:MAG TPA: hypothetical protein DCP10_07075 [Bacteroidales bacterium]|nr:hypothetical protein [Bacteroidales bacterium]